MVVRHACLRLAWLIAFVFTLPGFSQSLEDLESEVLGGQTLPSENESQPQPPTTIENEVKGTQSVTTTPAKPPSAKDEDETELVTHGKTKEPDAKVFKDVDDFISGPKSIPFKHIFVVKHQYIFKAGRHEIVPFVVGIQPGDSFRKQFSMGASYLYHLNETWSIEALHFNFYSNLETGFAKSLFDNTGLEVERVEPVWSAGSAIQWAPFQGKSATGENIYHFEGYLLAGLGLTQFEVGSSPMAMAGLGARMFLDRRSTLKFEVRDYYDFKNNGGNRVNIMLGAGILLGAPKL